MLVELLHPILRLHYLLPLLLFVVKMHLEISLIQHDNMLFRLI
jgi:hypothetical protein